MIIPTFITDNTDEGRNIVRFLIDVMNDDLDGCSLSHRLAAARLLVIYQHADASDFIADNTTDTSATEGGEKIWATMDPGLRTLVKVRTDDGRVVCMFLIDVMEGRIEKAHVGHRVSAARELLNRAFGKSPSRSLPRPQRPTATRRSTQRARRKPAPTPEAAVTEARVAARIAAAKEAQSEATHQPEPEPTHQPEPKPTHQPEPKPTHQPEPEPTHQPEPEPTHQPELEANDGFDLDVYRAAIKCPDPNFDPMLEATSDEYFWNHGGCDYPKCPYHGEPDDFEFDPEDFHY